MNPNKYQIALIGLIAILWLCVGNLIIRDVIRKKGLSSISFLNPFVIFQFDTKDWAKMMALIMTIVGLMYLMMLLG